MFVARVHPTMQLVVSEWSHIASRTSNHSSQDVSLRATSAPNTRKTGIIFFLLKAY